MQKMKTSPEWWANFFDETFGMFMERANDPETTETINFIAEKLNLQPGDHVYDQCCGQGPLSLQFARKGYNVTGVDQASSYIEAAKEAAIKEKLDLRCAFHTADAFNFVVEPACEGAINWYSSFGYLPDDSKNVEMFERLYDSLKPGRRVAVEYMNVPQILKDFKATFVREKIFNGQKVEFVKESRLDYERGMITSKWTYNFSDGHSHSASGESRLYNVDNISGLLGKAGFQDIEVFGDLRGRELTTDSARCILIALKPSL